MYAVDQGGAVTRGGVRQGGGEGLCVILTVVLVQVLCPGTPGVRYLVRPAEQVLQNGYYCYVLPLF